MGIADMTGSYGDDEREEPLEGEAEAGPFDDELSPFAEEEARENAGELLQEDELPLADEDARLPWLEGDDDDEEYGGYRTGQPLVLVVAAVLVLAMIGGGIWWLTRSGTEAVLVADGGTIESEGPYKQRPDDPGGKVFEGTGDSSFKVSEGQSNPARLGQPDTLLAPGFETLEIGEKGEVAAPAAKPASETGGVGVQVGAYSDRSSAETGWSRLTRQHGVLKGLRHRVVEGTVDNGTVYRLQALADDASAAKALCDKIKASGGSCYVKR